MPEAGDMIELGFLSDSERELILEVLQRDEELRLVEEQRVRKLKVDLLDVRRKGAKRSSGKYSPRSCGRCQQPLSTLTLFSTQCKMCNHRVCRACRELLPDGSWVCNVCAKELDLKKMTGDWFYDQRINRFSSTPLHDIISVSLQKKPASKKRETAGEALLKSNELHPHPHHRPPPPPPPPPLPPPVHIPRENYQPDNKSHTTQYSVSIASKDSFDSKPAHSDTESAENTSITSSKMGTESRRVSLEQQRKKERSVHSSLTESIVSSLIVPVKADAVSCEYANPPTETKPDGHNPELDVDRIFKKSVKRSQKAPGEESVSTMDLRHALDNKSEMSIGKRSRSVPGLDVKVNDFDKEDEGEEDEDIDSLVHVHKRSIALSSSSLHSSKSTLGSMVSVYSGTGDFDSVDVSGDIVFSLSYDEQTQSLHVLIKECYNVAYGDSARQLCNPYVKCYLMPDKSRQSKRKTSIKRRTINPVYNETLKYPISRSKLFTRSMLISVWHYGRLSRNAFLGEVDVALDSRDLDSPYEDRVALMPRPAPTGLHSAFAQYKGELVISLKYIPAKKSATGNVKGKKAAPTEGGELQVLIKEAKNLMAMKPGGTSDSFVKGYLYPIKAKTTKRKTCMVKKNLNPHYNHIFVYKDLALEQLKEMCLELTVWDKEAMTSNEFLGGVRLSCGEGMVRIGKEDVEMDSVGEEVDLWEKMMQYPDSWAEGTLPLRSTMGKSKGK